MVFGDYDVWDVDRLKSFQNHTVIGVNQNCQRLSSIPVIYNPYRGSKRFRDELLKKKSRPKIKHKIANEPWVL